MGFLEVVVIAFALSVDAFVCSVISGKRRMDASMRLYTAIAVAFAFGLFQFLMPIIGFVAGVGIQKYFAAYDHWVAFVLLAGVALNMIKEAFFDNDDKECCANSEPKDNASTDVTAPAPILEDKLLTTATATATATAGAGAAMANAAAPATATRAATAANTSTSNDDQDECNCACSKLVTQGADKKIQISLWALFAMAVGTSIDALAVGVSYGLLESTILMAASIIGVICAMCSFAGFFLGQGLTHFKKLDPVLNSVGALVLLAISVKILLEHNAFG